MGRAWSKKGERRREKWKNPPSLSPAPTRFSLPSSLYITILEPGTGQQKMAPVAAAITPLVICMNVNEVEVDHITAETTPTVLEQ